MRFRTKGLISWFSGISVLWLLAIMFLEFVNRPLFTEKKDRRVKTPRKNYICSIQDGRLGNHLFQYAAIYGIARRNNFSIVVTENYDIVRAFNLPNASIFRTYFSCFFLKKIRENRGCFGLFDDRLMNLPKDKNYVVGDWLQSWKYFRDVFPEIRKEFIFREHIKEPAEYIVRNLKYTKSGDTTTVGIHIRAGDRLTADLRAIGYRTAPPSYVQNAIEFMLNRFKRIVFIVCSEDLEYARNMIGNKTIEVYYFSISPAHDMAILSECDHVIMTVGTFGWWAGFLSNGTVVYYKYPYTENTNLWSCLNHDDHYLPDWIALE